METIPYYFRAYFPDLSIGTSLTQQQEKLWQHRYVDKVFADKYGLAPTNDFGVAVNFTPNSKLAFDLTITNGEGHKNFQTDSTFRYALGLTLMPSRNWVGRLYADWLPTPAGNKSNYIAIIGYASELVSAGMEWNHQIQPEDLVQYGYSIYASYTFKSQYQIFARADQLQSNKSNNSELAWNIDNNGQLYIYGFEYKLLSKVTIAIDSRTWFSDLDKQSIQYVFFDVMAKF